MCYLQCLVHIHSKGIDSLDQLATTNLNLLDFELFLHLKPLPKNVGPVPILLV